MDWLSAKRPLIIGHRGASADAPENTLYAFNLALEQGADGVELDVQLSRDGKLVVFHDWTVERVTNGRGRVADLTLAELQALTMPEGQQIPTLDEVFEAFGPRLLYNVEIKAKQWGDMGVETAVADRIQAHHLENRVIVSSFSLASVRRARQRLPAATPVGLLWYKPWRYYGHWGVSAQADHPYHLLVNKTYMAWVKKRGLKVNTWTVDDPQRAKQLVALGVDGIITNKPQFIRESLGL
ncbi:MAG: glycerophosphodiester phosphodiesterase [Ardenticatenaceae bacterium]|nr:glycerophosphodiester phosphodiesterase [Ardenticatenaceae bacterium]